jgi:DNA-binding IclR family transcriptional regulator
LRADGFRNGQTYILTLPLSRATTRQQEGYVSGLGHDKQYHLKWKLASHSAAMTRPNAIISRERPKVCDYEL